MRFRLVLHTLLFCLASSTAMASGKVQVKETQTQVEVCDTFGCEVTELRNKLTVKLVYNWGFQAMETTNESTEVTLTLGEFQFSRTLGEAVGYTVGDTKATFIEVLPDKSAKSATVLKLKVSWAKTKTTVKAMILDEPGYAHDFISSPSGRYPIDLSMGFGMETPSDDSIGLGFGALVGNAKVKQKEKTAGDQEIKTSRVTLKAVQISN